MRLMWAGFGALVVTWLPLFAAGIAQSGKMPLGFVLLAMCGTVVAGVLLIAGVLRGVRRWQWRRELSATNSSASFSERVFC